MPDHCQVMGDKQVGKIQLLLKLLQQIDNLGLDGDIQGRNRLIADDEFGFTAGPGNANTLTLAATEFMGVTIWHGR